MPRPVRGPLDGEDPRRPRRIRLLLILVAVAAAGFAGVVIADTLIRSDESVRNVSVGGVPVGGLSEHEIRTEIQTLADDFANRDMPLLTPGGTIPATAGQLGFSLDVEANVDAALAAGQAGASPVAWVSSFFGEKELTAVIAWDEQAALGFLDGFGTRLIKDGAPARLVLSDGVFVVEPGVTGLRVTSADVLAALRQAGAARTAPEVLVVEPSTFPPPVTAVELQPTADYVNARTARGVVVYVDDVIRDFVAHEVRSWLTVTPGPEPAIDLDTGYVTAIVEERLANIVTPGDPGYFTVIDGVPTPVNARLGRRCCAPNAAEAVLAALRAGHHEVRLHLTDVADSTGDLVAETGIRELVGEFTTYYRPGQSRVTNIRRIAELVQGAIIGPGETWSVNDHVGRRTEAKGFVAGGVIYLGKYQADVGGGVSQFATTLFNAAFFAGLEFGEYQAHTIYISRYPYGREATISYPHPDLQIVNNTPYSVLLWPTSTEESVTVQIYSTLHMTVTQSDQREEPNDQCVKVFTERTRTFADGSAVTDIVRANYQPAEGLNCQGEPFVPPPDCTPGQGAVDTDNDGWNDSCRALCPVVTDAAADGATAEGTDGVTGSEAGAGAGSGDCVAVCTDTPAEGTDAGDTPCIPLCGPGDAGAPPGSCARPEDIPTVPAAEQPPPPEGEPATEPPADAAAPVSDA